MVSYTPFQTSGHDELGSIIATELRAMSLAEREEFLTYEALLMAARYINKTRKRTLSGALNDVRITHGNPGVGGLGVALTLGMARAVDVEIDVVTRHGDVVRRNMDPTNTGAMLLFGRTDERGEHKVSIRDHTTLSKGRRRLSPHFANFAPNQLDEHAPATVLMLAIDVLTDTQARVNYLHGDAAELATQRDRSTQDSSGKYNFSFSTTPEGTVSDKGANGRMLLGSRWVCADMSEYQARLAGHWN